jgi:hypothetical protein
MADQASTPSSPWRTRYTGTTALDNWWFSEFSSNTPGPANVKHSGYAPEFPSIPSPLGLASHQVPPGGQPILKPSDADLDRLFTAERLQTLRWDGLTSWQLTSLNYNVPDDATDQIAVNEANWPKWFRRALWYNLEADDSGPQGPAPGLSVDDQVTWEELSICIEMAWRMLKVFMTGSPW